MCYEHHDEYVVQHDLHGDVMYLHGDVMYLMLPHASDIHAMLPLYYLMLVMYLIIPLLYLMLLIYLMIPL